MYYLVVLTEMADLAVDAVEHEPFIDDLAELHAVLLGGPFDEEPWPGVVAAYVLHCDSREAADAIVAADPLVASGAATAAVVRWDLVGIDLDAVEPHLTDGG